MLCVISRSFLLLIIYTNIYKKYDKKQSQKRLLEFGEFSKFISFLESIGVIALIARSDLNGPIYGVGPVYQHIFGWSIAL